MMTYNERQAAIQEAATAFPATFELRGFPGRTFRINGPQSFVGSDGQVSLVVDIRTPDGWRNFSRGLANEIRREIREPLSGHWAAAQTTIALIQASKEQR